MSEATTSRSDPLKVDPETLVLKAAPRRVVRFKRRLLIGIAAIACVAVFGVTGLALQGPAMRLGQQAQELYNTERKPTPDGLAALPGNYGQLRADTPQLGPPLPGDLGGPILERQRQLRIVPPVTERVMAIGTVLVNVVIAAAMLIAGGAGAEEAPTRAPGWLFRQLAGDTLEKEYGIGVIGWAELSAVGVADSSDNVSNGGFFNTDTGFNLNQLGLMACRGDGCPPFVFGPKHNLISRIGPFPRPRGDEFDLGLNVTAMWGEDVQFLRTAGFDDFNHDNGSENLLAVPQWFIDVYAPIADGATLMLGSFQTPLENDIGYPFTPPNWFATHTYGFQHGPAKHVGGIASVKIPTPEDVGLLSVEGGVVASWNNLEEARPTFIGGLRWRSPDFRTWIDLEAIYGDGEGDSFGPAEGGSPYVAVSSTDENLNRFAGYLVATHQATDRLQLGLEATYGFQEGGDVSPAPFFITEDSEWYGVNISGRYKLTDTLHAGLRGEWFRDENAAHVLWGSQGATGGSVFAVTAGLDWQPSPFVRIRPELRYDNYTGGGAGIFDNGAEDEQLLGMLNVGFNF